MTEVIDIREKQDQRLLDNFLIWSQTYRITELIKIAEEELSRAEDLPEAKEILEFLRKYKDIRDKYKP